MGKAPFFYRITDDIRVTVRPTYLDDHSRPAEGQFVFAYIVRIENIGGQTAQLISRRWVIWDSVGEETEIEGEGVVGEQPILDGGAVHEYQSYCVLKSPQGHMEGSYNFVRDDGSTFSATIPRFALSAEGVADPS